jgi:hypothetical protein
MLRDDMDYEDRFRMTVKHYGREVVIELNRGKASVSDDERTVTIRYRAAMYAARGKNQSSPPPERGLERAA